MRRFRRNFREAGFAALTGTSDFRTIATRAWPEKGDSVSREDTHAAKLAYNLFLDRIINYVSSYVVKILGTPSQHSNARPSLDGIVFSGGIGEKSVELRRDVISYFKWLAVEIDEERNASAGKGGDDQQSVFLISKDASRFRIFVCLTVSSCLSCHGDFTALPCDSNAKISRSYRTRKPNAPLWQRNLKTGYRLGIKNPVLNLQDIELLRAQLS